MGEDSVPAGTRNGGAAPKSVGVSVVQINKDSPMSTVDLRLSTFRLARAAKLFMALLLLLHAVGARASGSGDDNVELAETRQLIDRAVAFSNSGRGDSAMLYFNRAAKRCDRRKSADDKRLEVRALLGEWSVYFFFFFDYSKAFETLAQARIISEQHGVNIAPIDFREGLLYHAISDQCNDEAAAKLALNSYQKAFNGSGADTDTQTHHNMMVNYILIGNKLGNLDAVRKMWGKYERLLGRDKSAYYEYNELLLEGMAAQKRGQYKKAVHTYNRIFDIIPFRPDKYRNITIVCRFLAQCYVAMRNYPKAISIMERTLALAEKGEMKDAQIEIYKILASYYDHIGEKRKSTDCLNRSVVISDSLLNYQQLAKVHEMRLLLQMQRSDIMTAQEEQAKRRLAAVAIGSLLTLAVIILVTAIVVVKNRRLTALNKELYNKNQDILRAESQERQRRKSYEEEIRRKAVEPDAQESSAMKKYKGSRLTDDVKQYIDGRIIDLTDNCDEIFSSDFSLERMAQLIGVPPKHVSQVINERYQCNFNSFINRYRIHEACRRINDEAHYGNYTLEAISKSVGFKARSSFIVTFKAFTGMTPSEYQRISKSKGK